MGIHQRWETGVECAIHGLGRYRTVASTDDAAHWLLYGWPVTRGKAFEAAKRACLRSLDSKAPPEKARTAFIKAVEEAHIDIRR